MAEGGFDIEMDHLDGKTPEEEEEWNDGDLGVSLPEPPSELLLEETSFTEYGDRISGLQGDLRTQELKAQRDRLVDSFYDVLEHEYGL